MTQIFKSYIYLKVHSKFIYIYVFFIHDLLEFFIFIVNIIIIRQVR